MTIQSTEADWLGELVAWTEECERLTSSSDERSAMPQDVQDRLDNWQSRIRNLRDKADAYRTELLQSNETIDAAEDIESLRAEAHQLKSEFEQLTGKDSDNRQQESSADASDDTNAQENNSLEDMAEDGASEQEDSLEDSASDEEIEVERKSTQYDTVPIGKHTLPPLPYNYNALEPYISERIMRLHHDRHHQGYVDGLNKAEKEMQKARKDGDYALIRHWEDEAAFNGAGHYLHTIFWENMSPDGGGKPNGDIAKEIKETFGGFDKFKEHFSKAAENVQAVGWAMLVWSPRSRRTEILQAEKHQNLSQQDMIPLLVLDVWEHAYYLQYYNKRKDYIDAWWNVVCWDSVNRHFNEARKVMWKAY